jgi:hypothetical protein
MLPADRPWPPRRIEAPPSQDGVLEIVGQLLHDAELRVGADGTHGVLQLEVTTGKGFPYEVLRPITGSPTDYQAAKALAQSLRRGTNVRIHARGAMPRLDHGLAVLRLLDVTDVTPIS